MSAIDDMMSDNDITAKDTRYRIGMAVHQLCGPDWKWDCPDPTVFNGWLIWLVEGGEATLQSPDGSQDVRRGDFFLMPGTPGGFYRGRHNPKRPLDVSWMHLHPLAGRNTAGGVAGQLLKGIHYRQTLDAVDFPARLMRRITSSRGAEQENWTSVLLHELRRQNLSRAEAGISGAEASIAQLCKKITEDPALYRTLNELPLDYPYSKGHLIRLFKKYRGITPGEFIIRTRIDHARLLLKIPGMSIKQVAADLGYPDAYTFSKQFKACAGIPPGAFRSGGKPAKRLDGED